MKRVSIASLVVAALAASAPVQARDICDLLKDKGILKDDIEFNECRAGVEQKDAQTTKTFQDFVKDWIQYKEGTGFIINSGSMAPGDYRNPAPKPRFSFAMGNRLQVRYTFLSPDSTKLDESSRFQVRRFKTFLNGNAFFPWLKYKVQENWVGFNEPDRNSQTPELEDAFIDVAYFPAASLEVGQYKVPFDRQELTSSGAQQFVDRSISNGRFSFVRDQGVMFHGVLGDEKMEWIEYSAGVFNGNGRNKPDNDNPDHLGVVRLYFMPMGPKTGYFKYSESDTDNTAKPSLAIGTAYGFNPVTNVTTTTTPNMIMVDGQNIVGGTRTTTTEADADIHRITVDAHFKWRGASAIADYFYESRDDQTPEVTVKDVGAAGPPVSAPKQPGVVNTYGINLQAGYFLIPRKVEIAGRFAMFDPEGPSNRQEEARGAINWYIFAHNLKLQADFGAVTKQVKAKEDTQDFEARTQLQLIF